MRFFPVSTSPVPASIEEVTDPVYYARAGRTQSTKSAVQIRFFPERANELQKQVEESERIHVTLLSTPLFFGLEGLNRKRKNE